MILIPTLHDSLRSAGNRVLLVLIEQCEHFRDTIPTARQKKLPRLPSKRLNLDASMRSPHALWACFEPSHEDMGKGVVYRHTSDRDREADSDTICDINFLDDESMKSVEESLIRLYGFPGERVVLAANHLANGWLGLELLYAVQRSLTVQQEQCNAVHSVRVHDSSPLWIAVTLASFFSLCQYKTPFGNGAVYLCFYLQNRKRCHAVSGLRLHDPDALSDAT